MHPPLCIVGPSDASRVVLLASLVAELADAGRVGTIKSIHHSIEIDTPGKDTYCHHIDRNAQTTYTPTGGHV